MTHPRYRADIDGLRAVAVLAVIGFHAFPDHVRGGFTGVDVFFVISGFLISAIIFSSLDRDHFSFTAFYARRIRRIFPALLLVLAACLACGWFTLLPGEYQQLGKHVAGGAGFVSNLVLWGESGYFDRDAETKPLLHLWSLGIEEQFYIVWPLLLWFAWRRRGDLLAIVIVIALVSFALNVAMVRSEPVAAFYSPQTRFWELMAGSALAYGLLHARRRDPADRGVLAFWHRMAERARHAWGRRGDLRDLQSLAGALCIVTGIFNVTGDSLFPGAWALLPTLGAVLIIAAGADAWLNRVVLSSRALVWIGLISYPLYLWHWPLLAFARILETGTPAAATRIAAILVAVALADATYRWVERPIRFGPHRRPAVAWLVGLMVVAGTAGYAVFEREGVKSRFPPIVQELTTFRYDYRAGYREGTCFLRPEQGRADFDACPSPREPGKRTLLIWGDSHAAHLYPGYLARYGNTANLVQRTASDCPPLVDIDFSRRRHCRGINDRVVEEIRSLRPDVVVLAANWKIHDWQRLEDTARALRGAGAGRVDLVGPVPYWRDGLPRQLYVYFRSHTPHRVPERMRFGLDPAFSDLDAVLAGFARRIGVRYVSAAAILCDPSGCLTRLGDTGATLVAWDTAHLTDAGSRYVVAKFPD